MTRHIVKSFSEELAGLTSQVARMGGLAEAMTADALEAVTRRDTDLAHRVIARDTDVDALQTDLERRVIRLIALRQPLAADLRQTIAALKISADLERVGDLAKNIAKRTLVINEAEPIFLTGGIERMGRLVITQLEDVLDAYLTAKIDRAVDAWRRDEDVDAHHNSLFRELLTYMMEDPRMIGPSAHLLFVAKNLERIGDHATNIAEIVHFWITGDDLAPDRPKQGDRLAGSGPVTALPSNPDE
ncbi:MAG: phosphate signaling complex protein PhoU [Maricaulaceae bacterium]